MQKSISLAACLLLAVAQSSSPAVGQTRAGNLELDATTLAAAKKEGTLTFYSAAVQEQNDALVNTFQAAYQIKVNVIRSGGGIIQSRLEGDFKANRIQADAVDLTDRPYLDAITKQGRLADLSGLPAWGAFPVSARTQTYVSTSAQVDVIGFNTEKVKASDLKTWTDIADPKWKDAVALVDPRSSSPLAAFFAALDRNYGDDFLRKIAALNPKVFNSGTPASQVVVSGEASIGFPMIISVFPSLKDSGAPIDYVQLGSPNMGPIHYTAVLAQAPHPYSARLFMNFMSGPKGQAAWNGNGFGSSFLPGVPGVKDLGSDFEPPGDVTPQELNRLSDLLGLR